MTVFVLESAPRQPRNGFISAFILSAGLAAALAAGITQAYLRKNVTVTFDGQTISRTTYAWTVAGVLADVGVSLKPMDEVSPPLGTRLTKEMRVVVRHAVPVTLVADGQRMRLESAAATVGDLLSRRGIALHDSDAVIPEASASLTGGMLIQVVRIEHSFVTEPQEIPYDVRASRDPTAPRGLLRVVQSGRPGLKERLFKITLADGTVVGKELVGERLMRTPLDRVIRIGTLVRIAGQGPFAGREYLDMVATGYSPFCCLGVHDITSAGLKAGYGVVAVDPTVIPLGSRLYVEGYGYAIAGDVGGLIKGLRIDLGFTTRREALRYGVHRVRVYIIQKR